MLIPIGTKVVIKFTGESGTIVKQIDEEMFGVQLEDMDSIVPVHGVDIKVVKASQPTEHNGDHAPVNESLNLSFQSGIHVVFKSNDHHLINKKYSIHLANMTDLDYVYEYKFSLGNDVIHTESQRIVSQATLSVGKMMYEDLNEKATIDLSIARMTTAGLDPWQQRTLHLKMKQFFTKQEIGLADGCIYHAYLLTGWQTMKDPSDQTKLKVQASTFKKANPMVRHRVISAANFVIEIDLHIDKLTANHEGLDKFQKLLIQMESMKRYVDKAKNLNMDRVFLIHGIGKGRLRRDIAKYLDLDSDVLYHKNEYHPKYGYGATEVVFR